MRHWSTSMHIRAEHETEPTLTDDDGNSITFEGEGTYSLTIDGETYTDLSALDVSFYLQTAGHDASTFE